jgi:hypothetical protein
MKIYDRVNPSAAHKFNLIAVFLLLNLGQHLELRENKSKRNNIPRNYPIKFSTCSKPLS